MQKFEVVISDGVSQIVEAENANEARQKVKAEIAKGAVSPFYDKLFFDYDTGVNFKGLRGKLGRAETQKEENKVLKDLFDSIQGVKTAEDQDSVIENKVGNEGFVRNTKGQLALTPKGLEELGLPIQQRTLEDGSKINLNTIIDENQFNLRTGDFADFSGIFGPIASAITFLSPQLKIIKGIRALAGGNKVLANIFASGAGSAVGKAAEEEIFDTKQGFQLQDRDELNDLYTTEFILGSLGQGIGEGIAGAYGLLLGRKAPTGDVRLLRQGNKGRVVTDVMKLDRQLGRNATEREIKKAIKDGKVGKLDYKFIPSQATLKKQLPGKTQQIAEQVLGPARAKEANAYLFGNLNYLLRTIDAHDVASNKYISETTKGSLDEQIQAARNALSLEEQNVKSVLNQLLKDVQEDALNVGDLKQAPGLEEVGENLIEVLQKARGQVTRVLGKEYEIVDRQFLDLMKIPENATKKEKDIATTIQRTISNTQIRYLKDSKEILKQFKGSNDAWELTGDLDPALGGSLVTRIENTLNRMIEKAEAGNLSLRNIRNDYDTIRDLTSNSMVPTQLRSNVLRVLNKLDDRRKLSLGESGEFIEGKAGADSIFTTLEINSPKEFNRVLAETQKITNPLRGLDPGDSFDLDPVVQKRINKTIGDLRDANRLSRELLEPFDRTLINRTVEQGGTKSFNPDEVYMSLVQGGRTKDLQDLFQNVRTYDKYKAELAAKGQGSPTTAEKDLKATLRKKLFTDAGRVSTDTSGAEDVIDFTAFARHILKFEGQHPGKIVELFTDAGGGRSTGNLVLQTVNQLAKLKPNLKPVELKNIINDFTTSKKGLTGSEQGVAFVQQLSELAKASEKRLIFESNKAITDLPNKGIEETVQAIFRPRSGSNIEILKETLKDTPEAFKDIQLASMQKLLSKSIDFNYNGKGNITDIFKPGHLKSALETYGDETLEAMFGKEVTQGLKDFQRYIDLSTVGEIGRGGSAGGLVAAGIAAGVVFAPLATLPTLAGLAVMRQLFSSPMFVSLALKTDKTSIKQAIEMARRAAGLAGVRYVNGEAELIGSQAGDLASETVGATVEEADEEGFIDQAKQLFQSTANQARDAATQAQQSLRTTQANIPLPDVPSIEMPNLNPLSQERLDLDEQLFGRPSRLG